MEAGERAGSSRGLSLSLSVYSLVSGPQVGLSQQWLSWEQWAESVWLAH